MPLTSALPRWSRDPDKRPWGLEFRSSRFLIITTVSAAVFTDIFLYSVIVPVIPFALQNRAGIATEHTQYWVSVLLAVYGAALLASSPIVGWLSDRFPARRVPFLLGLVMLAGATVFLAVGDSIALLIVGRVLQGCSAAVVWVIGLALVSDTVAPHEVGQAMGYCGTGLSLALLLGPLLGGVVFDRAGYEAVFAMCFALLGVDIVLRFAMIEQKRARHWLPELGNPNSGEEEEMRRIAALAKGASRVDDVEVSATLASKTGHDTGLGECSADTITSADLPARSEVGGADPAPRLSIGRARSIRLPPVVTLLASRDLLVSLWSTFVLASTFAAFDTTLPLHVRRLWGWGSLGAGLVFLPVAVPAFFSPAFGWATDRWGARWIAAAGVAAAGLATTLTLLVTRDSLGQKVALCSLLFVAGLGLCPPLPALMAEISGVVEAKERAAGARGGRYGGRGGAHAQAYALFNVAWALGALVGPLWGGLVSARAGWATMAWSLGLLLFVTAAACALLLHGWLFAAAQPPAAATSPSSPTERPAMIGGRDNRGSEADVYAGTAS